MSLLVVGSVAYDGIETPFGKVERTLGGSATYISLAASYFMNPIRLVGVVGNDFAQSDMDLLSDHDIDLEGLQVDESGKTFFWQGKYHYDLNKRDTLDTQLNVFSNFDPIIPDNYKESRFIALGNIEPHLQKKVLEQVEQPEMVVLDTMNFWIEGALENLKAVLKDVDMLIINDSEARELAGEPNLIKASEDILDMGIESLIIKKGEHGAMLFTDSGFFSAPAYPIMDIFDPTGAGDVFMGGLMGWLAKTEDLSETNLRRAMIFGSTMASFCVEEFGTRRLTNLTQTEINDRYREFKEFSEVPSRMQK